MVKGTTGGDASANAESQTQSASAEPEQKAKTPERRAEETGEAQFFDTTVVKLDKDGNEVLSDHLLPGETLRRSVTDTHFANKTQAKSDEDVREAAKADEAEKREAAEAKADAKNASK